MSFDRPYTFYYNMLPATLSTLSNGSGEANHLVRRGARRLTRDDPRVQQITANLLARIIGR